MVKEQVLFVHRSIVLNKEVVSTITKKIRRSAKRTATVHMINRRRIKIYFMEIIIIFIILIFSAIVHEVFHGLAAEKFGDDTAREQGRITLNPIPHIDLFGSILLPLFLLLAGSPIIFGAAKPVPVNFNNLKP